MRWFQIVVVAILLSASSSGAQTRDPAQPSRFLAAYDSGDHLHPSDARYQAMGDGIDLALFKPGPVTARVAAGR